MTYEQMTLLQLVERIMASDERAESELYSRLDATFQSDIQREIVNLDRLNGMSVTIAQELLEDASYSGLRRVCNAIKEWPDLNSVSSRLLLECLEKARMVAVVARRKALRDEVQ